MVAGDDTKLPNDKLLYLRLFNMVTRFHRDISFDKLSRHDLETASADEDMHSTQLKKRICECYLTLRSIAHGQKYFKEIVQGEKQGRRQKSNKVILFQSL
jgi:hypothetical protein